MASAHDERPTIVAVLLRIDEGLRRAAALEGLDDAIAFEISLGLSG